MQIRSSLPSSAEPTSSSTSGSKFNPEDYLTAADLKMLEYVTGTSSLNAAEGDSYTKTLADSIGIQREQGKLTACSFASKILSQMCTVGSIRAFTNYILSMKWLER